MHPAKQRSCQVHSFPCTMRSVLDAASGATFEAPNVGGLSLKMRKLCNSFLNMSSQFAH